MHTSAPPLPWAATGKAAERLGRRQTEPAHGAHPVDNGVGDAVVFDNLLFGGDQPVAQVALQLFDELLEDFGIQAGIPGGLSIVLATDGNVQYKQTALTPKAQGKMCMTGPLQGSRLIDLT